MEIFFVKVPFNHLGTNYVSNFGYWYAVEEAEAFILQLEEWHRFSIHPGIQVDLMNDKAKKELEKYHESIDQEINNYLSPRAVWAIIQAWDRAVISSMTAHSPR